MFPDVSLLVHCFTKGCTALGQGGSSFKKVKPKRRIGSTLKRLCSIVQANLTFLFCRIRKPILYLTDKDHGSLGPRFQVCFHVEPITLIIKSNTPINVLIPTANASKTMQLILL